MAERRSPTTARVQAMISAARDFPVGSVYLSVTGVDPNTELGYGTWSRIAQGKFIVGQDVGDADFDVAEETGGAKTHTHAGHSEHPAGTTGTFDATSKLGTGAANTVTIGHSHSTPALSHSAHNSPSHLPPYCVLYIWKRTA